MPDPRFAALLADPDVRALSESFTAAGEEIYLVGGSVRDALLGISHVDLDFTTSARPDDVERITGPLAAAMWAVGKRYGTIGAEVGAHRVEITTFRSDVYRPASRKPEVAFGDSLEEDLLRRDFTVNAMALSLADGGLLDPFGGEEDLGRGRLATPRSPQASFGEDPLRMLRACRFAAQLGLRPTEGVKTAIAGMRERLGIVSAERIRDELSRLVTAPDPGPGLWLAVDSGLAEEFLPELPALRLEQDPVQRHKDVLTHTVVVTQRTRADLTLRLAALLHDIGKPRTRTYGPRGVAFHHHDAVGARMAAARLAELRYPSEVVADVQRLIFLHLRFHTYRMGWTDSAVRRYVRDGGRLLDDLNELVRCDCTTRNPRKAAALGQRMDALEQRIRELQEKEALESLRPALDGRQVMAHLGIAPGPDVGAALDFLLEVRMEDGEIDEAEAYRRLDAWMAERD